jgi:hypothetical protein
MTVLSSRILKGGALLGDSRRLAELWNRDLLAEENLRTVDERNLLGKSSRARARDVLVVLRARFVDPGPQVMPALQALVAHPAAFGDACYYETARVDGLLAAFAERPLYEWFAAGRPVVSVEETAEWIAGLVKAQRLPPWSESTVELLATGESGSLEFKFSARWNSYTRQRDPAIELAVVKTVAGFMNAHGGTLLVGVDDRGEVTGLDHDLKTLGRRDYDGYENWLTTLLETSIGKPAISHLSVRFEQIDGTTICRIDVRPAKKPVFVSSGKGAADFYLRLNNSTRLLNTAEALDYIQAHRI